MYWGSQRLPRTPSSLPYLIEIFMMSTVAALYYTVVELENLLRTDRERRIQLQRPLLSPVDRRGERANKA